MFFATPFYHLQVMFARDGSLLRFGIATKRLEWWVAFFVGHSHDGWHIDDRAITRRRCHAPSGPDTCLAVPEEGSAPVLNVLIPADAPACLPYAYLWPCQFVTIRRFTKDASFVSFCIGRPSARDVRETATMQDNAIPVASQRWPSTKIPQWDSMG